MSAFVVSRTHIDALVAAAIGDYHAPRYPGDGWSSIYVHVGELGDDDPAPGAPYDVTDYRQYGGRSTVRLRVDRESADYVGRMLLWECVRSVAYRYPDDSLDGLPGPCGFTPEETEDYTYRCHARRLEPVEVLKAIDCYEYQSCEHPDWKDSTAAKLCDQLRSRMIAELPGYEEAAWGLDEVLA